MIDVSQINKSSNELKTGKNKKVSSGASFSSFLEKTVSKEESPQITSNTGVSATDALLSLQMAGENEEDEIKKKLLKRGKNLIERLEEIRDGLLIGSISKERLIEISRFVKEQSYESADKRLTELLEEIELRVEVELAKLMK